MNNRNYYTKQNTNWSQASWKNFPIMQQPEWPDNNKLFNVLSTLEKLPALVFSGETRKLHQLLSEVNTKSNFVLQVGNCAETFSDCNGPKIHNFLRIFLQMAMILEFNTGKKIVKIGRVAGQYAKPRSDNYETINGCILPTYRGDNVNDNIPTSEGRVPNPERLLEGYFRSAATLNLIRAFIQGGYCELYNINNWGEHYFSKEVANLKYYKKFAENIEESIKDKSRDLFKNINDQIYISHEALILDYEEAFTRFDTTQDGFYNTSSHFLWIGDRTRQANGAHVEFVSSIGNPIGLKIGPDYNLLEIITIIKKTNPDNIPGRLSLITRFGYEQIEKYLPPLLTKISEEGLEVNWICDPMHGNTFKHNDYKVRSFDHIVQEIKLFFSLCKSQNIVPGGVHLEITDEYVTECIGGICGLTLSDISNNYSTKVDPRLNAVQALEIAFILNELLNEDKF